MNIKYRNYNTGSVTLVPETIDDLYILYNIILPDDQVKSRTLRRIRQEEEEGKTDKGERIPMVLTLLVEEVKFHEFADRIRIKGKIISGPEDLVSHGSYHTFNVEVGTMLTIFKDSWSKIDIDRIEEAVKKSSNVKVIIVAIDDSEATIAAISAFSSNIIANFNEKIPKKVGSKEKIRVELINKFFDKIIFALEEIFSNKYPDASILIIAGPGFTKDSFYKYLKLKEKSIKIPLNKVLIESASCAGQSAIGEIFSKNILGKIIEDEQVSSEAFYLEEFLTRLGKNIRTVAYGADAITQAVQYGAIETLLIVDNELRLRDKAKRKQLDQLLSAVQKIGGKVIIISENHQPGRQVEKFGGKIALLRFPIN